MGLKQKNKTIKINSDIFFEYILNNGGVCPLKKCNKYCLILRQGCSTQNAYEYVSKRINLIKAKKLQRALNE